MHQKASFLRINNMATNYNKIFSSLNEQSVPQNLSGDILISINKQIRKSAQINFVLFSFLSVFSLIALIPALKYFISELYESGFQQYLSLIFSDGLVLLNYWKEFSLLLAESIPLISIALVLTFLLTLLSSIKFMLKNLKNISLKLI